MAQKKRRNPIARALAARIFRQRIVQARKGKGSYRRNRVAQEDAA